MNLEFSAYWNIKGNPKPNSKNLLNKAKLKNLDLLICDGRIPPSRSILKNIYKLSGTVNLKFNFLDVKADIFKKLCEVWTSKILLFNELDGADFYIWRDCSKEGEYEQIKNLKSDRVSISSYIDFPNFNDKTNLPFGGRDTYRYNSLLCAQVIKIPHKIKKEFIDMYAKSLEYIDRNFEIYDEEIVLSYMRDKNPDIFNVIPNTKKKS